MNTLEKLRNGELAGCTRLNLSCGLQEFPREIFDLADTLEILDLSGNALSSLPDDLPRLRKLRILFCSSNRFTELPAVLGQCPQLGMVGFKANQIRSVPAAALPPALRWLILTDNQITELPAELGRCTQLQKLMLAGNRLQSLPPELAACTRLELLRIAANDLAELPDWLFKLPRLSWLAYAGNPFCAGNEAAALAHTSIADIRWDELQLQHKLGEGASGVIHRAMWQRHEGRRDVAVKLFKGAVTSDGLPHSEMAACIRAGSHPNLIAV
ncbi:MAG TPA: leucine-rich repeat-containing protein kinase family protein, partial [Sideroxyarcus sp.]|nr:leucine-rich repeat-containing protein kinase family protein [Sideroxyarcus sp.]